MNSIRFSSLCVFLCMTLAACGVKPQHVDPPAGAEASDFPRHYPAPVDKP